MFSKSFLLFFCLVVKIENFPAHPNLSFNFRYTSHMTSDQDSFSSYRFNDDSSLSSFDIDDINHKISGGSYASHGQFPFMAIVHRLAGNGQYYVCGGSILSERWVLTAGHCIVNKPRKFFVAFGIVDKTGLKHEFSSGNGVISMLTTQGAIHPKYRRGTNDIGLLYMPKAIPFSDTIQPIKIADNSFRHTSFSETTGHVYGWGKAYRSGTANIRMKYGKVSVISNGQCRLTWADVDDTRLCTISTGDDVCQGDSGGPLVVFDEDDEPLQIGIVSYGDAGCPSSRPAVFTRVSTFSNWIQRVTNIDFD